MIMRILLLVLTLIISTSAKTETTKLLKHNSFQLGMTKDAILKLEKILFESKTNNDERFQFLGSTKLKIDEIEFERSFSLQKYMKEFYLWSILISSDNAFLTSDEMKENKVKIEEAFYKTLNNYKTKLDTDYSNKEWVIPILFTEDPNYCFRIEGEGIQEYYKVNFFNSFISLSLISGQCIKKNLNNEKMWKLDAQIQYKIDDVDLFFSELRPVEEVTTF